MNLSVKQAYYTMFYFLDLHYFASKCDDLGVLLGALNPYLFGDNGMPIDIAKWSDWKKIVKIVTRKEGEHVCLSATETFQSMLAFLNYHQSEFGFNLQDVLQEINENRIGDKDGQGVWFECIKKALESQK